MEDIKIFFITPRTFYDINEWSPLYKGSAGQKSNGDLFVSNDVENIVISFNIWWGASISSEFAL